MKAKQEQDITSNRILKRVLIENQHNFLKQLQRSRKIRLLAIALNQRWCIGKKKLSLSTLVCIFIKDVKDLEIIDADAYRFAYRFKEAQIVAVSMRDLEL